MLVVLNTPPSGGHATAESIEEPLNVPIDVKISSEASMPSLVHKPPTSSLTDSQNQKSNK